MLQRRSLEPLELLRLPFSGTLWFVLVNPKFEAPTKKMRAALPAEVCCQLDDTVGSTLRATMSACVPHDVCASRGFKSQRHELHLPACQLHSG